jgi:hypothetical protein
LKSPTTRRGVAEVGRKGRMEVEKKKRRSADWAGAYTARMERE